MQTNRKYGIDLLKIFSIIGVIVLHIISTNTMLLSFPQNDYRFWIIYIVNIFFYCSVNVFAMVSGYLLYKKKSLNSYRVFELLLTVTLYTIVFSLLAKYCFPIQSASIDSVFMNITNMPNSSYWYILSYLPILIISPFINKLINVLTVKQHKQLCIILVLLFCVIQSFFDVDIFYVNNGYSFLWLLVCYIIGAYICRENKKSTKKSNYILILFITILFLFTINFAIYKIAGKAILYLIKYNSPFYVILSVCLIFLLKDIDLSKSPKLIHNSIKNLSCVTIDVYLIHCHCLFFDILMPKMYSWILNYNAFLLPLLIIGCAIILYLMLSVFGIIRIKLFELLKVNKLFKKITKDKFSYTIE